MMSNGDRYREKPLLRLLECYVLNAIGQLSVEEANRLLMLTPKLNQLYARSGSWCEVLAAELDLPLDLQELIEQSWLKYQEAEAGAGLTASSQKFAEMFVDANLV